MHMMFFLYTLVIPAIAKPIGADLVNNANPPPIPITTTITDPTDRDISDHLSIRHYHQAPSFSSPLPKRTLFRPITDCPPGTQLRSAYCRRITSPQAIRIACRNLASGIITLHNTACAERELCVDDFVFRQDHGQPDWLSRAWCVSMVALAAYAVEGEKTTDVETSRSGVSGSGGVGTGFGVVLTSLDERHSVFATSVSVEAQRAQLVHGRLLWLGLPGGKRMCGACASLGFEGLPGGAGRVEVRVSLREGIGKAVVHLVGAGVGMKVYKRGEDL